jgi:hypothetical protein
VRIVPATKLGAALIDLLNHHSDRSAPSSLGQRAAAVVRAQSGATERTLKAIDTLMAGKP